MIIEIISTVIPIFSGFAIFALRIEHRLTKVETKVDTLLNHNGVNPKDCKKEVKNDFLE